MMGLLDTILGAVAGKAATPGAADPIAGAISALLTQNGGLQGLMGKFSQGGLGEVFSSWVGMGENKPVSTDQIQGVLGNDQVRAIAGKLGLDPGQASGLLAEILPKVVDKLTPSGQVTPGSDNSQGLAALLPGLLSSLLGGKKG
jgi:uncharacterized protein YidB (DUF937 family)